MGKWAFSYASVLVIGALAWFGLRIWVGLDVDVSRGLGATTNALPWLLLMSLGSYCLFKLGYDIFSYRDMPESIGELAQEIKTAKTDLRRKGMKL